MRISSPCKGNSHCGEIESDWPQGGNRYYYGLPMPRTGALGRRRLHSIGAVVGNV